MYNKETKLKNVLYNSYGAIHVFSGDGFYNVGKQILSWTEKLIFLLEYGKGHGSYSGTVFFVSSALIFDSSLMSSSIAFSIQQIVFQKELYVFIGGYLIYSNPFFIFLVKFTDR